MAREIQCPICSKKTKQRFQPGPNGRPNASCPSCESLERDRFLAVLLKGMIADIALAASILEVAPSRQTARLFENLNAAHVTTVDLDPSADGREVEVQASLTNLPFDDESFDLLLCYHVLEHIPEDYLAISEIARVLKSTGKGVIQVPWRSTEPTDEDPNANESERISRFGQADHVRYYGDDFEDRLAKGGLDVVRIMPSDLLSKAELSYLRINPEEAVWIVRPATAAIGRIIGLDGRSIHRHNLGVPGMKRELANKQAKYDKLMNYPPLKVASKTKSAWKRTRSKITGAS